MAKTFQVKSGKICIVDPCYDRVNCKQENFDVPAKNGVWEVFVKNKEGRIAELRAWCEIAPLIDDSEFFVGVDSGQAGIFDSEIYPHGSSTGDYGNTNTFYGKACELTLNQPYWGIIDNRGVVVSSGHGDGAYQAKYAKNKRGEIVGVKIKFI